MTITPPKQPGDYPDRQIDCQQALERPFQAVFEAAERAGWTRQERVAAAMELANIHYFAVDEVKRTERDILREVELFTEEPKEPTSRR